MPILKTLMQEEEVGASELSKRLNLVGTSQVYEWLSGEKSMLVDTAVKIANIFNCSLDYLYNRASTDKKQKYNICPPFDQQFRKVLKDVKVSQYILVKNKIVSKGTLNGWLNKKQTPHIDSIIRLADYLHVTMDYLVGRED